MKIYCVVLINEITGDIEHCITSDAAIEDKLIPEPRIDLPTVPTIPPTPEITFRKCFCEFDSDKGFVRGREALSSLVMAGRSIAEKTKPLAKVKLKKASAKIKNLKETSEAKMKADYEALI